MNELVLIISIPILIGIILFVLPEKLKMIKGIIALIVSAITLYYSILVFQLGDGVSGTGEFLSGINLGPLCQLIADGIGKYCGFNLDSLSKMIVICISIISFLILLYSLAYVTKEKKVCNYYPYFLITLGAAFGATLADNLMMFLIFWGILAVTLYKLIKGKDQESSDAAKKTLIIVGASDGIMMLGIGIIWKMTGSLNMSDLVISTDNALAICAFIALLIGAFTKAGAFPFHTWVPDYSKSAPASSTAYMPASLDKLLGIYFLARICNNIFVLNDWLSLVLLIIGVITIITAVLMALVQHNYKKLLGFHAVSQVGYMVVGFGLGTMIGIAAGLFHMINNAIYKSGLFLSAGSVSHRTGKENIEDLGGLSKSMPITFIAALIFALSISGIPPFNGFASKWMIYQGIIDFGQGAGIASQLWIVWLGLAILGSALTLASFIKFIGGIFLSRQQPALSDIKEVPFVMWLPMVFLALLCIGFGVFATNIVVPKIFMPISGSFEFMGIWQSSAVSVLVLVSIVLGILIYLIGNIKNFRTDDSFVGGGENMKELSSFSTPEFYKTLGEFKFINFMYRKASERLFDIYDLSKKFIIWFSKLFSNAHSGVLPRYSFWVFVGMIIMLLILL